MIELPGYLVNGFIGAAVSFLVGCLIVGIQVTFFTKNFEEEYGRKIDKIKLVINWRLEKALRNLFTKKKYPLLEATEDIKWMKVFPETIEDIRFLEGVGTEVFSELTSHEIQESLELVSLDDMQEIFEDVKKLKKWSTCSRDAKDYLRTIGKNIILVGIIISISLFIIVSFPEAIVLFGVVYGLTIVGMCIVIPLYQSCRSYIRTVHEIDETYEKIEKRSLDI